MRVYIDMKVSLQEEMNFFDKMHDSCLNSMDLVCLLPSP